MHFQDLPARLADIRGRIGLAAERGGFGQHVTVVAVTKSHGPEAVRAAFHAGLADVGENRVQEALNKMQKVDVPVRWHLIGHLQRNKAKHIDRFTLLHSLDSSRLADALSDVGRQRGSPVDVLLQINVSGEGTKGGFAPSELALEADRLARLTGVVLRGVMTMAPLDASEEELRRVFGGAREGRDVLARAGHPAAELSMGMSNDYEIAVEEGATMVRLGTTLFGARDT